MKLNHILAASFLSLLGLLPAEIDPQDKPPFYSVAIFDFSEGAKDLAGQGAALANLLNAHLTSNDQLILVERAELGKILAEQELSLSGNVAPENHIKAGKLTGAQILITGRVFQAGDKNYAVAKVIGSENGRVYATTVNYDDDAKLNDAGEKLAAKVSELLSNKGETLVPQRERYDDLILRLKQNLVTPLPTVYVKISEEHLSHAVPDPACQTEILKVIKDCGFPITEDPERADLQITGEAFSERSIGRGNLVACRARAEISISKKGNADALNVDRVMVGAVDLSENIAGKAALQEAGLRLAIRFVENQKNN